MAEQAGNRPTHTKLSRQQITGFWGAWAGWTLDGMDSVIYALVLSPALTELLPKSGYKASPANIGYAGSILFALFLAPIPKFTRHRPAGYPLRRGNQGKSATRLKNVGHAAESTCP